MPDIQIIAKTSHATLVNSTASTVKLTEASVVLIKTPSTDVKTITRNGTSAIVELNNGEKIVIQDFFSTQTATNNSLVFQSASDTLVWAQFVDAQGNAVEPVVYESLNNIEPLLFGEHANDISPWAWVGGVAAVGTVAAAIDGGGGSSGSSGADTTAPLAPTDVTVSSDGTHVIGKAEPNSTISIKDATGKEIGTGQTDANGNFQVEINPAQTNGESLTVTATDASNNTSLPTEVIAPDTTAPLAPTDVTVSSDGAHVIGKAEPNSTISIKDATGKEIGTGQTDANGNFQVEINPAQTNGESLTVTATDASNNTSLPTEVIAPDTTAPLAPT
ncbi:BapA prefix-like domain-containing protein, partial [Acinetobacter sp. WU_MDCI_Axc73]|nr:BapA prefix-like domain-containing protein [Acinetobacter sp. WU_MDCI_Axc73]